MAAWGLALLMSQAYSAETALGTTIKVTHSVDKDGLVSFVIVQTSATEGKYLAIALGATTFTVADTDVIVCSSKASKGAGVNDAHIVSSTITIDTDKNLT